MLWLKQWFLMILTFDLCSIGCHTGNTGITMRSFIGIRNVLMGDMAAVKVCEKTPYALCTYYSSNQCAYQC